MPLYPLGQTHKNTHPVQPLLLSVLAKGPQKNKKKIHICSLKSSRGTNLNKIQQYSLCPAVRTGFGCSVLISGSPRTASTTCYFYLTYTRRTAQTGHLHGLLSLFPGLRCLLLLQLFCHLGLPLNLTEALAAHFLGSKTFFCTQLRKKEKKHTKRTSFP